VRLTSGQKELLAQLIELTKEDGRFPREVDIAQRLDADRCIQQLRSMARKGYVEQCGARGPWKATRDNQDYGLIWEFEGTAVSLQRRGPTGIRYRLPD
jgi:predicted transcriptional regulator